MSSVDQGNQTRDAGTGLAREMGQSAWLTRHVSSYSDVSYIGKNPGRYGARLSMPRKRMFPKRYNFFRVCPDTPPLPTEHEFYED